MTLPPITDEDRQFLHYNPNTDDVVQWVRAYAQAAVLDERGRWKRALHVRLDSTVMSKYANRAECEAARAALRNALLDVFGA